MILYGERLVAGRAPARRPARCSTLAERLGLPAAATARAC